MSGFPQRMKEARLALGLNKTQMADLLDVSASNITRYENGNMNVSLSSVAEIGEKLKLNPGWLMGWSESKYLDEDLIKTKKIPIVGTIAAGTPILAFENITGYESVLENEHVTFCLRVQGDSMNGARIYDGDLVYIRQQAEVENGEIAAIIVDGEAATIKRFYKYSNSIVLRPENPVYSERVFEKAEMKEIKIIGKVIAFKSEVH